MLKTLRVMLIPNDKQRTRLFQFAGTARFAYNWALEQEKKNYDAGGKFLSDYELRKRFTLFKNEPNNQSFSRDWPNTRSIRGEGGMNLNFMLTL